MIGQSRWEKLVIFRKSTPSPSLSFGRDAESTTRAKIKHFANFIQKRFDELHVHTKNIEKSLKI